MIKKLLLIVALLGSSSFTYGVLPETQEGFYDYITTFIQQGGEINTARATSDDPVTTLLHHAAQYGYADSVLYLLNHGAQINALDSIQQTPLHLAVQEGHIGVVQLLIGRKANVSVQDAFYSTPLHNLCETTLNARAPLIAEMLLQAGADITLGNDQDETPLRLALGASEKHKGAKLKVIQLLKKKGINSTRVDHNGNSILHTAIRESEEEIVEHLLQESEDLNIQNDQGNTLLHEACFLRDMKKIELLLRSGVEIALKNSKDQTPLMAFLQGAIPLQRTQGLLSDVELVQLFLEDERTDIEVRDSIRHNLLHYGVRYHDMSYGSSSVLALLILHAKYLINDVNDLCRTPLYNAVLSGNIAATEMLLQAGAHTQVYDKYDLTPLGCVISSTKLDYETKLKLAHLLVVNSRIRKGLLGKNIESQDIDFTMLNDKEMERCGIDNDFITQAISSAHLDQCRATIIDECRRQEYGMQRTQNVIKNVQQRELTGRWHPYRTQKR